MLWCPLQFPSLHPVVCRRAHAVLFTLFEFVCVYWCPTHIVLCICFSCLRLVYPMLPISLDCPFVIVHSVFFNVYLIKTQVKCILNILRCWLISCLNCWMDGRRNHDRIVHNVVLHISRKRTMNIIDWFGFLVFNATFNNISVISWLNIIEIN